MGCVRVRACPGTPARSAWCAPEAADSWSKIAAPPGGAEEQTQVEMRRKRQALPDRDEAGEVRRWTHTKGWNF